MISRRILLAAGAALPAFAGQANDRVRVGIMGLGRGRAHGDSFAKLPDCEVAYVCDVDRARAESGANAVATAGGGKPKVVTDFREMLDDKNVDVLSCAAPNHWHAPSGILACAAGKHVYIEKPCSHNPREGELLVAAARANKRCVQMGNQRRSYPKVVEAMARLREGAIGRLYHSRSWYGNQRGSIGRGKPADPPPNFDYALWQGPAPRRPFVDNLVPYNWHWRWHWGNGELGNNGVHSLDLNRWGLGVDFPVRVTSSGGRYRWEDDQETPDTHVVTFEFEGRKSILWEGMSCNSHGLDGTGWGATFHGEKGTMTLNDKAYVIFDSGGKKLSEEPVQGGDAPHFANFLAAIRAGKPEMLNSEIAEGHKSTLLCHLGNIAHRTGRAIKCDPKDGHILGDDEAAKLWSRDYEKGWEPKV